MQQEVLQMSAALKEDVKAVLHGELKLPSQSVLVQLAM